MTTLLVEQMERVSDANSDPEKLPAVLMSSGGVLTAAALSLIIFKTPGGIFLRLHGGGPVYSYYGILAAMVILGLAVASFGFWVVPRDLRGWHATGKTLLWFSILALVLVAALGGLAFLNNKVANNCDNS
ncbi:hypothetical protein EJB05_00857, partial [Eragrostis curvula]